MEQLIDEFVVYLRNVKKTSENTILAYKRDLLKMVSFMNERGAFDIKDVTVDRLSGYTADLLEKNMSNASVIRNVTSIKAFFRYLVENGNITDNPSETLKAPKAERNKPRILSTYEIDALLNQEFSSDAKGMRDRAILELMYATGLKASELITLKLGNVDMSLSCLRLPDGRVIPYGKKANDALNSYLLKARTQLLSYAYEDYDTVFLNYTGEPMSRQGLWKLIKTYVKRTGIDMDITPNTLRHSFVSHLIENGADAEVVQELVGYSDKGTISRYMDSARRHDPYEWARLRN